MTRDELRSAIEKKTAEVNAALAGLGDLVDQATKAGLIVGIRLIDTPGKGRQKTVAVSISERIEVPMPQPAPPPRKK
jgi:hypothetical protein